MQDILRKIQALGVTIIQQDGNLHCTPAGNLTAELRQAIRNHKQELVEFLQPKPIETSIRCRDCQHPEPDTLTCARGHKWIGLQLLHICPDFLARKEN